MPINPYFKDYSGEQDLVEDLTIEIIKAMGRDMIYMPRMAVITDELYGEQRGSYFKNGIPIEMYIDSVSGFEGQGDIATKFGIEIRDNVSLTVSKKRFIQEVKTKFPDVIRPREGDLIFFPLARALFEINFVEHENPFYQHGKLYSYKLTCELMSYNTEEVETGNTDIDAVVAENENELGENDTIQNLGTNIIDFTETDPFSEGQF
jgi:hypothetical protein